MNSYEDRYNNLNPFLTATAIMRENTQALLLIKSFHRFENSTAIDYLNNCELPQSVAETIKNCLENYESTIGEIKMSYAIRRSELKLIEQRAIEQFTNAIKSHNHTDLHELLETNRRAGDQLDFFLTSLAILESNTQALLLIKSFHRFEKATALKLLRTGEFPRDEVKVIEYCLEGYEHPSSGRVVNVTPARIFATLSVVLGTILAVVLLGH